MERPGKEVARRVYNIWFDCCAVFILSIVLLAIYVRNSIPITQNRIFTVLVWLVLISTFCDFFTGLWNNMYAQMETAPVFWLRLANYLYFIARNATPFVYLLFIMTFLDITHKSRIQLLATCLPFLIDLVLIGFTPFFDWVFYVDGNGLYHRGPLLFILYIISVFYMLVATCLVAYYRKSIPLPRQLAFYSFATLALGTVCVQGLFPTFLVEGFGTTLCVLLIYLTIQRPEEVLDGQSGLLNKSAFQTMLSVKFRRGSPFEVIGIRTDDVGLLEKSLSLEVVTRLTATVAAWLRQTARHFTIYRCSDGTIGLITQHYAPDEMEQFLQTLAERFSRPWEVAGLSIAMPASFLRIRCPEDAASQERVTDLFDMLKDQINRWDSPLLSVSDLDVEAKQRQRTLREVLLNALDRGYFEVYYQPIYSTASGRFTSAEALLRLRHPRLGMIPPDEFIPLAEQSGLIVPIGRFVLDSVCRFLAENQLWTKGVEYIEVNLSVVECLQDDLEESISKTLHKYHLEPERVNFEITETATNTMPETVLRELFQLADSGVRFSLDDYGTGYSNMTRMLALPLDIVKIDKSLVQNMFEQGKAGTEIVLSSTFQMLQRLDKHTLAEGVETQEQADRLIQMGCEYIQGYHYARPMPGPDYLAFLSEVQNVPAGVASFS